MASVRSLTPLLTTIRNAGTSAMRRLAQMEGKYRGLFEAAPDAMVVVNSDGDIVLVNVQTERQFGFVRDELLGQKVNVIIPEGFAERLTADDARSAAEALVQQIGTGLELTGRRKDGSEFPIELMLSPLESAEGILVTAAIRDISERKAADRDLAQMQGKYSGLLEAAPDAMVVVNGGGDIVLRNAQAERQFGYMHDELLGKKVTAVIPEGFAERLIADDARSAAEALVQQIGTGQELIGRRKDGSEFPIELMLSPLESAEGILVTAAIRDISERKAADRHLAQMEGKYSGLLEAAPDAMVVVNSDGDIVLVNVQTERQFGFVRDELLGQKVNVIIPEGFAERLTADDARSAAEALVQQIGTGLELTGRRKDGSEFPIELMLSPLESAEGILVTAAIRDISVRKAADRHLAQMEGKYRGLLEAAPDAMVVVNRGGDIVLVNVQTERQFGYMRDELLGKKVTAVIPEGFAERLTADDARSAAEALVQQIGTGLELIGRRKDGSEFPIELMLSPLESAEGILVTAAIRDISVRKAAARHLAQMEGKYRGLLEAAPDAMVVVNSDGDIVLVNVQTERQFGFVRDELLGQKVNVIIPEGFAERLIADDARSAAEALVQQIGTGLELIGRRKDDSEFPIELMLSPLESAEGILVTAAIRDLTARHAVDEQLRQSQKMEAIGNLTGGMAHDFNNLLSVVIGNLDLQVSLLTPGGEAIELAGEALDAALRGAELNRRLLAFARRQPLAPQRIVLNDLVADIVKLLERTLGERVAIALDLGTSVWPVMADPTQLEAAVTNLATNARDAMPGGGSLTIATANRRLDDDYVALNPEVVVGDYALIEVSDTGVGMTPDVQARIFEPFYTTKELGKGTGLGLSMVFGFIKQSGGHVGVYSEPGIGTTFRLYLPRATDAAEDAEPAAKTETPLAGGETVLVVEDNAALRRVAVRQLTDLGYRVIEASSASDALAELAREKIDVLFSDIVMPGKFDGHALARHVAEFWPSVKVVLTSGFAETNVTGTFGALAPTVRLLSKPYRRDDLAHAIRNALGTRAPR